MSKSNLEDLQEILGYRFREPALLTQALTHSSYANEAGTGHLGSNERLEYLGDAVLELVSSRFFYDTYPDLPEGRLTTIRASLVCEPALCDSARAMSLSRYLLLGKGEESTGGRERPSILSDALEAVIGAVYLDGGYECARDLILRYVLNDHEQKRSFYDSKTILQEEFQKTGRPAPEYRTISEEGPDHRKIFTAGVYQDGTELARGSASSKKHAEQQAAFEALKKLGVVSR